MRKIILNNETFMLLIKSSEMEKIVLSKEQFSALAKQLGVSETLAKKALKIRKILLPSIDGFKLDSYSKAAKMWSATNVRTMEERFALMEMIRFALLEERSEGHFFEILNLSIKSVDETGQILVIRAVAQKMLQEELIVI